jgi:hypothetical protein
MSLTYLAVRLLNNQRIVTANTNDVYDSGLQGFKIHLL